MASDIGHQVASRILQLRQAKKMTQEQLAERANIDASVISRIERESRTNIRLDTLNKIVEALGTNYEEMFSFTDSDNVRERIQSKLDLITDDDTLSTIEKLIDLLTVSKK
ncbi:helix-turn-helix domain-containing protein [Levilactobacillus tujiorum]|uniref:helix-turn-helix domain-containing protein n=1 Tax=Levilactobacillus tujiorum TaxID=2912243 RepID=UPI0014574712|nr:helix-turn-helix transcriptional regulator [Levilactobacillus tujiorum]NLR31613.1 helix-turn-helix transcriptional regulator [Levilactobacillus tujiorum]